MKTIVLGIITKNEKFLIGKLKEEKIKDFGGIEYVFPGGKIEATETADTAVIRELEEETGLKVSIVRKIHVRIHPITQRETHYFHCISNSGTETTVNKDNDDIEKLIWVKNEDLINFMPTINPQIISYFANLK